MPSDALRETLSKLELGKTRTIVLTSTTVEDRHKVGRAEKITAIPLMAVTHAMVDSKAQNPWWLVAAGVFLMAGLWATVELGEVVGIVAGAVIAALFAVGFFLSARLEFNIASPTAEFEAPASPSTLESMRVFIEQVLSIQGQIILR